MMEMAKGGVRTRARALALATEAAAATSSSGKRKRLVMNIQLRSSNRRRVIVTSSPKNHSISHELNSGDGKSSSSGLNSGHSSASCCSSNGSEDDQRIIKFSDLQDERSVEIETSSYRICRERREATRSSQLREAPSSSSSSSDELDTMAKPSKNTPRKQSLLTTTTTAARKMIHKPSESELEEFFAEAEKNMQKRFADKYNYDIVKDEPMEGRYEWVRLRP